MKFGHIVPQVAVTLPNENVTLAMMANMATASLLGRNTAGTGVPQVLSAATAGTLLGIVGANQYRYPVAQSSTYVKASSTYNVGTTNPEYATDPTKTLTGAASGNAWRGSVAAAGTNRFHIDLGMQKVITKIYYENYHGSGIVTDVGVRAFTLWGTNSAASFAVTTYATDTGWTQLTTSVAEFDQHTGSDIADPKYITVTNTTHYRYYCLKFSTNWGATTSGVRRIELYGSAPNPALSRKTAAQTWNSDIVLADVNDMCTFVEASKNYLIEFILSVEAGATPDISFAITGPAAPTTVKYAVTSGAGLFGGASAFATRIDCAQGALVAETVFVVCHLNNGGTAGTVQLQACQRASNATSTTVNLGSVMRVTEL